MSAQEPGNAAGDRDVDEPTVHELGDALDRALLERLVQLERTVARRERKVDDLTAEIDPLATDAWVALRLGDVLREATARAAALARQSRRLLADHEAERNPDIATIANVDQQLEDLVDALDEIRELVRAIAPRTTPRLSAAAQREADRRIHATIPLEDTSDAV